MNVSKHHPRAKSINVKAPHFNSLTVRLNRDDYEQKGIVIGNDV